MILDDMAQAGAERLFYDLQMRVGALGKYQYINLFIWSLLYMLTASVMFFNPFLFYQQPYNCADRSESECLAYVCSLPEELRGHYVTDGRQSMIDRLGDYHCEKKGELKLIQSIIYISGVVGIILSTYLNGFIRKKLIVQAAVGLSVICFSLMLIIHNLTIITFLLSINYASHITIAGLIVCFLTQTVHEQHRGSHIVVTFIFYNLGSVLNGILFKLVSWQSIFTFYFMLPLILTFAAIKWYIKETPFDLVTNFTPEEAYRDFHWIAEQNGNADNHEITVEELRAMRAEYEESLRQKQQNDFGVVDLVRFKSLRSDTVCCCIIHFMIFYSYSGPLLAIDQFSADIYINDIVFGLGPLITSVICYFVLDTLPRKKVVFCTMLASFLFIIPMYLTIICKQNCNRLKMAETLGVFIFRMLVQFTYQTFYLIQNQVFPTQVRSLATLLTALIGNTAPAFIPLVVGANESYRFFFPSTFLASAAIVIITTSRLRETLGTPPPEIISELTYQPAKGIF